MKYSKKVKNENILLLSDKSNFNKYTIHNIKSNNDNNNNEEISNKNSKIYRSNSKIETKSPFYNKINPYSIKKKETGSTIGSNYCNNVNYLLSKSYSELEKIKNNLIERVSKYKEEIKSLESEMNTNKELKSINELEKEIENYNRLKEECINTHSKLSYELEQLKKRK